MTAERGAHSQSKFLPEVFEDAHPWPLQWGGTEVKEGRFYAVKPFNAGAQKRIENAGRRLAEVARHEGASIRGTVAVTRYQQRNLLERATYKFEAVIKVGDEYKIAPLGEITLTQDLSPEQRRALVEGKLISDGKARVLEYRLDNRVIRIDTEKAPRIPSGDVFVASESRLADFIHGLKKSTPEPKTAQGKQIQKDERAAIVNADKESKDRTAAKPAAKPAAAPQATDNKSTEARTMTQGRPTQAERAAPRPPQAASPSPAPAAAKFKPASPSPIAPNAEQVKQLEKSLSNGMTRVVDAGGNHVKVILKKGALVGVGAVKGYNQVSGVLQMLDERIPVLDPSTLMQNAIEKRVSGGIEEAFKWLNTNYPPVQNFLKREEKARESSIKASEMLAAGEPVWRTVLSHPLVYPSNTRVAIDAVMKQLTALYDYGRLIDVRIRKLAPTKELALLETQLDQYVSALRNLASELEDKAELALMLPFGYYFGIELLGWSFFVQNISGTISSLSGALYQRQYDYQEAVDKGIKVQEEIKAVLNRWDPLIVSAQQALGI